MNLFDRLKKAFKHEHRWTDWYPINQSRVVREPGRAFIAGRSCTRCGQIDQLIIVEPQKSHDA